MKLSIDVELNPQEEYDYLRGLGYKGTINDMRFAFLTGLGFKGAINDKLTEHGGSVVDGVPIAQTAIWGDSDPAGTAGWRPQLADLSVESLTSYDSLTSGSLGAYTPSISSGKLVFTGASGAPDGAVLRCTGASGRVYDVTIDERASTIVLSSSSDATTYGRGNTLAGYDVYARQDARLDFTFDSGLFNQNSGGALDSYEGNPPSFIGEGSHVSGEYHFVGGQVRAAPALIYKNLKVQETSGIILINNYSPLYIKIEGCYFSNTYLDKSDSSVLDILQGNTTGVDGYTGFRGVTGNVTKAIRTNTGNVRSLIIKDCTFDDCYLPIEASADHYFEVTGSVFARTYFDAIKNSSRSAVSFIGGNLAHSATGRPAAATGGGGYDDDPHHDWFQTTGVNSSMTHDWIIFTEANMFAKAGGENANSQFFLSDSNQDATVGHRFTGIGNLAVMGGSYPCLVDAPADCLISDCTFLEETPDWPSTKGTPLTMRFPQLKSGEGSATLNFGSQVVNNVTMGTLVNSAAATVTETGTVNITGLTSEAAAEDVYENTAVVLSSPTYQEVLDKAKPTSGGVAVGKGAYEVVTAGSPSLSDYTIDATAYPLPVLSGVTVTPTDGGFSATATSDEGRQPVMWIVNQNPTATAEEIRSLSGTPDAYGFSVLAAGSTAPYTHTITESGLTNETTYYFHAVIMYGSRSTAVSSTAFTPTAVSINYVDQSTNDARYNIAGSTSNTQDYFVFSALLTAPTPEHTSSRLFETPANTRCFYSDTDKEIRFIMEGGGTVRCDLIYTLDLDTEKHIYFRFDGINGTAEFYVDGVSQSVKTTNTAASTGTVDTLANFYLFDSSGANRSLRATDLSQVVVSTTDIALASVYTGGAAVYDISGLTAEIILGYDMTTADWNSATQYGSATLSVTNTFVDV